MRTNLSIKKLINNNRVPFFLLKEILKNSIVFIIFSFLNVFLPIFICLISANLDVHGAYAAMGIGYVTSFLLAYSQIGFTFVIFSTYYVIQNKKNNKLYPNNANHLIYDQLFIALIYGLIILPLFIGPAYLYTKHANAHINTIDSLEPAYNMIYSSSGFVFLTTIASTLIMNLYYKLNSKWVIFHICLMFGMMFLFSAILSLYTPLKSIGLGLGLSIGTLISCLCSFIHNYFVTDTFKKNKININKTNILKLISYTWRPILISLSIQIFKGGALLLINYETPTDLTNVVPLNYQMSRIIWYNMMYLIPFVTLGFADSIYFYFAINPEQKNNVQIQKSIGFLFIFASIVTILITVICSFLINPLASEYVKNQVASYDTETIKVNLLLVTKEQIISIIKNNSELTELQKQEIINILNTQIIDGITLNDFIARFISNNFLIQDYIGLNANSVTNLMNFPNSFAYFYLGIYCIFYPLGQLLNAARLSISSEKHPAILMVFAQGLAILFIVLFGIGYQKSEKFFLMEAWSFPLAIIGIIAFLYMGTMYFLKLKTAKELKINKNNL
ncbi:hypothetical protein [Mycoplasmoides alvi]|uniref:hypothetical protein n=1 Tax=Mycoplasmoides alvi TaxID=78580 RepID=UPI000A7F32E5|nr:hypothetical protein [Mycoplasmoides alvi]